MDENTRKIKRKQKNQIKTKKNENKKKTKIERNRMKDEKNQRQKYKNRKQTKVHKIEYLSTEKKQTREKRPK